LTALELLLEAAAAGAWTQYVRAFDVRHGARPIELRHGARPVEWTRHNETPAQRATSARKPVIT